MFFDDPKRQVTTIMSKRNPGGERKSYPAPMKPEISKEVDGSPDGKFLAAQDILSAHHNGSAQMLKEAMENFMDMHMSKNDADGKYPDKED